MQCYPTGYQSVERDVLCCPDCGSLAVFRRSSRETLAHWRCRACDHRWTEAHAVGLGKACNAKLVAPLVSAARQPGRARLRAEVRACAGCHSTRVRATATSGRIAYWQCETCGQGWSELARPGGWGELKVKLAAPRPARHRCNHRRRRPCLQRGARSFASAVGADRPRAVSDDSAAGRGGAARRSGCSP